jgi:hypothetical protein
MTRPYQIFDSSDPLVFDGNVAVCFIIQMNSYAKGARIRNIAPGVFYTFIFHQDGTGGHEFEWPGACLNAPAIGLDPNLSTVQNFIGVPGGYMQANIPGTRH